MKSLKIAVFIAAITLVLGVQTSASAGMYIKFDGIDGESQYRDQSGWVDVLSYATGHVHQPGGSATGATRRRASSTPDFDTCVFSKYLDKATPKLQESCCTGVVIPKVTFEITRSSVRPGDEPKTEPYMVYELKNVLVTSVSTSGSDGDEVPTEDFSLNFEEIRWTYTEIDPETGKPGEKHSTGWDLSTNSPTSPSSSSKLSSR